MNELRSRLCVDIRLRRCNRASGLVAQWLLRTQRRWVPQMDQVVAGSIPAVALFFTQSLVQFGNQIWNINILQG